MFQRFAWKRKNEKRDRILPIQTVFNPGYIYKASGALPATPGVRHTLLCVSISKGAREALLAEGFSPIGGASITHGIFCTFTLPSQPNHFRCLFNLYLDLSSYPFPWADWAAKQITASRRLGGLRRSLAIASSQEFLIRCKTSREYPFCLDDQTIDEYWLMDAEAYMRAVDRLYQQTKL